MRKKIGIGAALVCCIGIGAFMLFPVPIASGMLRALLSSLGYKAELKLLSLSLHEAEFGPSSLCIQESQACVYSGKMLWSFSVGDGLGYNLGNLKIWNIGLSLPTESQETAPEPKSTASAFSITEKSFPQLTIGIVYDPQTATETTIPLSGSIRFQQKNIFTNLTLDTFQHAQMKTKNLSFDIEQEPFTFVLKAKEISYADYFGKDILLRLTPLATSAGVYSFAKAEVQLEASVKELRSPALESNTLLLQGSLSIPEKSFVIDKLKGALAFGSKAASYPFSLIGKGALRESLWHFEGTPIFAGCVGVSPLEIDFNAKSLLTTVFGDCVFNKNNPRSEFLPQAVVQSGELRVGVKIKKAPERELEAVYSLQALDLETQIASAKLQGVNGIFALEQQGSLWNIPLTKLSAERLDAGLVLTKVQASIQAAPAKISVLLVQIPAASAEVLGGNLFSKNIRYQPARKQNEVMIGVQGIDLEQVIKLYKQTDIFISGKVDGSLPIFLTSKGVLLEGGSLKARAPGGSIQITGETAASIRGMAQLELVRKALEDYLYTRMELSLGYTPDGMLKTGISLSGKSRSLNNNRPVNVNINLEENILSLIRSLGIVGEVQDKILEKRS